MDFFNDQRCKSCRCISARDNPPAVSALQSGHLVNPLHYMDHFTRCQVPNKNQSEREISFHFINFITCLKLNQVLLRYLSHREMVWNLIRESKSMIRTEPTDHPELPGVDTFSTNPS